MSSADPDSNQGPKDISFSTVLRSTNWAIGGCLFVSRFDFFSSLVWSFVILDLDYEEKKTYRKFHKSFSWFNEKIFLLCSMI